MLVQCFQTYTPWVQGTGYFDDNKEEIIQIVVKAQKYRIKPNTSYSCKWHVEGKTENIVARGVYYCKIEPEA